VAVPSDATVSGIGAGVVAAAPLPGAIGAYQIKDTIEANGVHQELGHDIGRARRQATRREGDREPRRLKSEGRLQRSRRLPMTCVTP
jgi:hypothetical protein